MAHGPAAGTNAGAIGGHHTRVVTIFTPAKYQHMKNNNFPITKRTLIVSNFY